MIWNSVEFIVLCINGRGMHPVLNLVLDLLQVGTMLTASFFGLMWYSSYDGSVYTVQGGSRPICEVGEPADLLGNSFLLPPVNCALWRVAFICGMFCLVAGYVYLPSI
jgi:hypothetical protein